ncbi:MAG: aminotransferase class I/II-fold pyridoxal phosphate-dependent enzyme, partial [Proteobacteria bacterium]|nr:aminotransferase class I/II-fold pyridoxal phosphate-dependent enzyme [Pseudomonadota bacterium]
MSAVPGIPLSVPDLRGNEAAYLARCVADNWVSSAGPFVVEMEAQLARLTGRAHGVAMVNGTAALHLALVAAGIGAGDRVIVPDWTFGASANAVYHAGAEPYFVDVTAESWTLDRTLVARVLADPEA